MNGCMENKDSKKTKLEWVQLKYPDGRIYFWNKKTDETTWNLNKNIKYQTYENFLMQKKKQQMKIQNTLNQKNQEISKLTNLVNQSQQNLKKCKKDFTDKSKEVICGIYKVLYKKINILESKHIVYGIELREKNCSLYITKIKSSNCHSLSVSISLEKNKMYTICIDTSDSKIEYHLFANNGKENKKFNIEQVYKKCGNIKKNCIKYFSNYDNIILMLDFKKISYNECIIIHDFSIFEIDGDNLSRFKLTQFDDIVYKDSIPKKANDYIEVIQQSNDDFIHPPIKTKTSCCPENTDVPCCNDDSALDPNNPFTSPLFAMGKKKELIKDKSCLLQACTLIESYELGYPATNLFNKLNELLPTNYNYNSFKNFLEEVSDYNELKDEIGNIESLKKLFIDLAQKIRCLKDITTEIYNNLTDLVIPTSSAAVEGDIYSIFINWHGGYNAIVEISLGGQWNLSMPLTGSRDDQGSLAYIEHILNLFIGKRFQIYRTFRKKLVDNSIQNIFGSIPSPDPDDPELSTIEITPNGVNDISSSFYEKLRDPKNINTVIKILLEGCAKLQDNINYFESLQNIAQIMLDELNDTLKLIDNEYKKYICSLKEEIKLLHQKNEEKIELLEFYIKTQVS